MLKICGSIARSFGRKIRVGQLSTMAGAMALRLDVGERLGREHDGSILLAQRLEPFAQAGAEGRIVEREPAFVDDEQGRLSGQASFNSMEQIGEHRRCGAGADQAFGLEGLHIGFAEMLRLRHRAAGRRDRRGNKAAARA